MTPAHCEQCGTLFDASMNGTWVRVEGWMILRPQRTTGRTQSVREQQPTGRYLCPSCGKEREMGIVHGQQLLIDNPNL